MKQSPIQNLQSKKIIFFFGFTQKEFHKTFSFGGEKTRLKSSYLKNAWLNLVTADLNLKS